MPCFSTYATRTSTTSARSRARSPSHAAISRKTLKPRSRGKKPSSSTAPMETGQPLLPIPCESWDTTMSAHSAKGSAAGLAQVVTWSEGEALVTIDALLVHDDVARLVRALEATPGQVVEPEQPMRPAALTPVLRTGELREPQLLTIKRGGVEREPGRGHSP